MPANEAIELFKTSSQEVLQWYQQEIKSIRSGRVHTELVAHIPVEHYGTRTPLNGLASISSSDARTLVISPWDKGVIAAIEKSLTEANIGVNPNVDQNIIRLVFPSLTTENREQTVKQLHKKTEEGRVKLRQHRDEMMKIIKQDKEGGKITEDDFYETRDELDAMIEKTNNDLEAIQTKKEEDIRTI